MKTRPPGGLTVPVSLDDWNKLLAATAESGYTLETWEIGSQAVHDWLVRNSPQTLSQPCTCGYQWKQLFLPKGTLLRTVFNGKHYHCVVEDDGPRFNNEPTSPSRFANAVGGVRRNAWRVIWVLFPNTTEWKLADSLRTKRRACARPRTGAGQGAGQVPASAGHMEQACGHCQAQAAAPGAGGAGAVASQASAGHGIVREREQRRAPPERRVAPGERRRPEAAAGPVQAGDDRGRTSQPAASPAAKAVTEIACYATAHSLPLAWWAPLAPEAWPQKSKRHPQVPFG